MLRVTVLLHVFFIFILAKTTMMTGGIGELQQATPEIQELIDKVKPEVEQKTNADLSPYTAVSYKSQVVAGINYFVKVKVAGSYIHLRVFDPLPHANMLPNLAAVQTGKSETDEITYFQ